MGTWGSVPAKHNNILCIHDDIIHIIVEEHIDLRPIKSSPSLGLLFFLSNSINYQSTIFSKSFHFLHNPSPTPSVSLEVFPVRRFVSQSPFFAGVRPLDASVAFAVVARRSLVLQLRVVPPHLGLELDELFGDLVVGPLGQDSQDGQSRLVHVDAAAERQPAGARALQGKKWTMGRAEMRKRTLAPNL